MGLVDPGEFKELVRSRTDIVALIGESRSVIAKRGGREYVALCPFHDDRNPSMTISPERQSYKCWSCNEGGDVYAYVMKTENLGFRDALELLASRAGLEMPKSQRSTPRKQDGSDDKKVLSQALTAAKDVFHQCLLNAPEAKVAREYLYDRGFSEEMWIQFSMGYHPNDWNWLLNRFRNQYSPAVLKAAQLVGERNNGNGFYDYFVDRLLFPIFNVQGQTVAFGGRVLPHNADGENAKYWNSPESLVFSKSSTLYGLETAKDEIRRQNLAVVVEGYTDCISLHQYGIANVVGTLGTALTEMHVTMLKRFSEKVIIVFDGDNAGQAAAERSLSRFIPQDLDLRILTLPNSMDPADYLEQHGAEEFNKLGENAPDSWTYKLNVLLKRHGLGSDMAKEKILNEMLELIGMVPRIASTPKEDLLIGRLARRIQINEHTVRQQLKTHRQNANTQRQVAAKREESRQVPAQTFYSEVEDDEVPGDLFDSQRNETPLVIENLGLDIEKAIRGELSKEDELAREALEIAIATPEWTSHLLPYFPVDRIENCAIRTLFEELQLIADEPGKSGNSLRNRLENPDLIRLAVWIEEAADNKSISEKMKLSQATGLPTFLMTLIEVAGDMRERIAHSQHKNELLQQNSSGTDVDEETARLLKEAGQVNLKRQTKRSPA